jgi:hypothetical protein
MPVDSLNELKSAFAQWRSSKKHVREPVPEELLALARHATKMHGVAAVVGATRVDRARLLRVEPARTKQQAPMMRLQSQCATRSVPAYSRLELSAPAASSPRPIAEIETGSGVKVRVFEQTPEMVRLLSALCGVGALR